MCTRDCAGCDDDLWRYLQNSRPAIRARAMLVLYTVLLSAPFIALVATALIVCGFPAHEVTGLSCYNTMITTLFFFDVLRNTAHATFAEAMAFGLVTCRGGAPRVDPAYRHHRLASLSFAVGGTRMADGRE